MTAFWFKLGRPWWLNLRTGMAWMEMPGHLLAPANYVVSHSQKTRQLWQAVASTSTDTFRPINDMRVQLSLSLHFYLLISFYLQNFVYLPAGIPP